MNEAMFVADLESWNPPMAHVGMFSIGHMNGSPATQATFVAMIKVGETMQIEQVPLDGRLLTIDLKSIKGLMPTGDSESIRK